MFVDTERLSANDRRSLDQFSAVIGRLQKRRLEEVRVADTLARSKLAWKFATLQQAMLYRVVMLAEGCALSWNATNVICTYLSARSLMETIVLFIELESDVSKHVEQEDLAELDRLFMNRTFASRQQEWVADHPDYAAVNVLTLIDKVDRRVLPGVRAHYERLSEVCHPNSAGHTFLFGKLDRTSGTVSYSHSHADVLHSLLLALLPVATMVELFEQRMDRVDDLVDRISELQHLLNPVR